MEISLPTWCPSSETLRNMTVGTAYREDEVNIIDFNLIFPIPCFLVYFTVTVNNHRNQIPEPGTTISGFADSLKKKN
jgi:hypothetical protein